MIFIVHIFMNVNKLCLNQRYVLGGFFYFLFFLTDYYGHAWPMCATSPQCENTFGMPLVHHRAELAFLRCFVTPCHIVKFYLHVLSHRHVLSPRDKTYRKIHSVHGLSLFPQQHCNTSFLFPRCVYRCVRECTRALCCVVFYYPRFR